MVLKPCIRLPLDIKLIDVTDEALAFHVIFLLSCLLSEIL